MQRIWLPEYRLLNYDSATVIYLFAYLCTNGVKLKLCFHRFNHAKYIIEWELNKSKKIIIIINCNWVVTRRQCLFYMYTKHEIGYHWISVGKATWEACSGNLESWEPSQHLLTSVGYQKFPMCKIRSKSKCKRHFRWPERQDWYTCLFLIGGRVPWRQTWPT